ncbi:MAG: hypothetical protein R3358_09830 [Woeseiaceae bacterium]|nr:hypothetical protein [Woeseiaceae bacterium]
MSVRRRWRTAVTASLLGACSLVLAADDELPKMEFLEYLGLWDESDEDWLIFESEGEALAAGSDEDDDAVWLPRLQVPQADDAAEKDDES